MTNYITGASLLSGISSGLSSTYSLLASQYSGSLTLDNIVSARSNTALASTLNQTFASYLQNNFSSLDSNKDGKIEATELSNFTNQITTQGLTRTQLTQLGTASGMSTETLEQVLDHFSDIDANHDGKVTTAEISAYSLKSQEDKKKSEYANKAASNMSVFYGDDSSSSDTNYTSMVDFKYMKNGSNSSSSSSI